MNEVTCKSIFNEVFDLVFTNFEEFDFDFIEKKSNCYIVQFNIAVNDVIEDFKFLKNACDDYYHKFPCNFDLCFGYGIAFGDCGFFFSLTVIEK